MKPNWMIMKERAERDSIKPKKAKAPKSPKAVSTPKAPKERKVREVQPPWTVTQTVLNKDRDKSLRKVRWALKYKNRVVHYVNGGDGSALKQYAADSNRSGYAPVFKRKTSWIDLPESERLRLALKDTRQLSLL